MHNAKSLRRMACIEDRQSRYSNNGLISVWYRDREMLYIFNGRGILCWLEALEVAEIIRSHCRSSHDSLLIIFQERYGIQYINESFLIRSFLSDFGISSNLADMITTMFNIQSYDIYKLIGTLWFCFGLYVVGYLILALSRTDLVLDMPCKRVFSSEFPTAIIAFDDSSWMYPIAICWLSQESFQ